jgi:hypothetical protein
MSLNKTTVAQIGVWALTLIAAFWNTDAIPADTKPLIGLVAAGLSVALHKYSGKRDMDGVPLFEVKGPTPGAGGQGPGAGGVA